MPPTRTEPLQVERCVYDNGRTERKKAVSSLHTDSKMAASCCKQEPPTEDKRFKGCLLYSGSFQQAWTAYIDNIILKLPHRWLKLRH